MSHIKGQKHTPFNKQARVLRVSYILEMGHPSVKNTREWVFVYDKEEVVDSNPGLMETVRTRGLCMIIPAYWVDNES